MNAKELVEAMREGATLKAKWKPRTASQKPRRLFVLTYPDGRVINVQRSTVDAARRADEIRITRVISGDIYHYGLTPKMIWTDVKPTFISKEIYEILKDIRGFGGSGNA